MDSEEVELVGGLADGYRHTTDAGCRSVHVPVGAAGYDEHGRRQIQWLVYRDTGRRTADGRRVFAPA